LLAVRINGEHGFKREQVGENFGNPHRRINALPRNLMVLKDISEMLKKQTICLKIRHRKIRFTAGTLEPPSAKLKAGGAEVGLLEICICDGRGSVHDAAPVSTVG